MSTLHTNEPMQGLAESLRAQAASLRTSSWLSRQARDSADTLLRWAAEVESLAAQAKAPASVKDGAKDNAVLQAQSWAQEARTQRATVLDILRYFGLPEHDWEALRLIKAKLEGASVQDTAPSEREVMQELLVLLEELKPLAAYGVVGSRDIDQATRQRAIASLESKLSAALAAPTYTRADYEKAERERPKHDAILGVLGACKCAHCWKTS